MSVIRDMIGLMGEARRMPEVTICLMADRTADNDPFYAELLRQFHASATRRHPRCPVIRAFQFGVALCVMPASFDDYFMAIEAAARRNYKKALRNGFEFRSISFNEHLAGIAEIRRSTPLRQGRLSKDFLEAEVVACKDPPSRTPFHTYPYYGVFKNGKLVAYSGCLVMGEAFLVEQIYGHADYLADGVVPMLLIGMAADIYSRFPQVKYYGYGTYFGAGKTMRRFKKKFLFLPHRVEWEK